VRRFFEAALERKGEVTAAAHRHLRLTRWNLDENGGPILPPEGSRRSQELYKDSRAERPDSAVMATHEPSGGDGRSMAGPAFPQRNAFVLQFTAESGPQTGRFDGRIQHVASGRQMTFGSLDELWSFVGQVLLAASGPPVPVSGDG
jgi:hypothetical protein